MATCTLAQYSHAKFQTKLENQHPTLKAIQCMMFLRTKSLVECRYPTNELVANGTQHVAIEKLHDQHTGHWDNRCTSILLPISQLLLFCVVIKEHSTAVRPRSYVPSTVRSHHFST